MKTLMNHLEAKIKDPETLLVTKTMFEAGQEWADILNHCVESGCEPTEYYFEHCNVELALRYVTLMSQVEQKDLVFAFYVNGDEKIRLGLEAPSNMMMARSAIKQTRKALKDFIHVARLDYPSINGVEIEMQGDIRTIVADQMLLSKVEGEL